MEVHLMLLLHNIAVVMFVPILSVKLYLMVAHKALQLVVLLSILQTRALSVR